MKRVLAVLGASALAIGAAAGAESTASFSLARGVIVGLAGKFGLPIHAVGVGERADDLRPFDAGEFARALVGL